MEAFAAGLVGVGLGGAISYLLFRLQSDEAWRRNRRQECLTAYETLLRSLLTLYSYIGDLVSITADEDEDSDLVTVPREIQQKVMDAARSIRANRHVAYAHAYDNESMRRTLDAFTKVMNLQDGVTTHEQCVAWEIALKDQIDTYREALEAEIRKR